MADTYISLQQAEPTGSEVALYTCPGGTSFVGSSLIICNENATPVTIDVRMAVADAADDPKQYLYQSTLMPANSTLCLTAGLTMTAGDVLYVNAAGGVSFQIGGVQIA